MPDLALSARNLSIAYRRPGRPALHAVSDVSFDLAVGDTLGIVGESGCGKSSLAKQVLGLVRGDGEVHLLGSRIDQASTQEWRGLRRQLQYVFQDPLGALDPRMTVLAQVREPLDIHRIGARADRSRRARTLLEEVGIGAHLHLQKPPELSGGQRQRIVLARALILEPDVLLCDEPVSALDVSVQAQILNLLSDLRNRRGLTMLFISHDLAVIRHVADRVGVLYMGRMVEIGPTEQVFRRPAHPYTRALLDAAPGLSRRAGLRLDGEAVAATIDGCPFAPRCPLVEPVCSTRPSLAEVAADQRAACHRPFAAEAVL